MVLGKRIPRDRPFVYLNVATTADGKLAPASRRFEPFSSRVDRDLLMELRTYADAVMSGARTVDLFPASLGPGGPKYRQKRIERGLTEYNLRVIVSGAGSVSPRAEIFKHHFSPIIVLTTERAGSRRLGTLRKIADDVHICGEKEIDFPAALRWLRSKWGVRRLLCEGGGEVNGALFEADLVDEIFQTLCPVVFGGRDAPTMADGEGVMRLADATDLALESMKRIGDELYLIWKVVPRGRGRKRAR